MLPITIKHLDQQTSAWINQEARKRDLPPDQLISELLRELVSTKQQNAESHTRFRLADLAGTWDDEALQEFVTATVTFKQIDPNLWP